MIVCCTGLVKLSERYPAWNAVRPVGAFPVGFFIPSLGGPKAVSIPHVSREVEISRDDMVFACKTAAMVVLISSLRSMAELLL